MPIVPQQLELRIWQPRIATVCQDLLSQNLSCFFLSGSFDFVKFYMIFQKELLDLYICFICILLIYLSI